jgi:light-regulated signal transduction histidine kinase (bacteriophytochrome)
VARRTRSAETVVRMQQLFDRGAPLRESVDVNGVIREMIALLRGEASRHAVTIRTELMEDLSEVAGDRVQLKQVLMNLMINGIEAMNDGDGTRELTIKSQRAENGQIAVSVGGSGVGLPPLPINQIFNAFYTTKPHSIGIGLSISRSSSKSMAATRGPPIIPHAAQTFTSPSRSKANRIIDGRPWRQRHRGGADAATQEIVDIGRARGKVPVKVTSARQRVSQGRGCAIVFSRRCQRPG